MEDCRGTTDEFETIPFHLVLFSAALVELAKYIPVHSLVLSSHHFICLPLFLFPFTVPCRLSLLNLNHLSFRFLTRVRSSLYSPMAAWIFLRTSSLVTCLITSGSISSQTLVRNPSETDSIKSQIPSKTSSGKKDSTKDAIKDTTSDSQVNSCFPYRWPPASLTLNIYFYLFLY